MHADTNLCKLKGDWKFQGLAWSKVGVASHVTHLNWLYFKMNRWNKLIFACWFRFTKIKSWSNIYWVGMVKNVCGQSGCETIKLTVSQDGTDRVNWFFACWYKFRKAKSWFNHFWVCLVKICCFLRMNIWIELIILMLIVMQ